MAESPAAEPAQIKPVLRRPGGQLAPGTAPLTRNGGRPALPAFLSENTETAAAMIVAAATGSIVPGFEDNAAIVEMASECDGKLRILAANSLLDRVCGKAKEHVQVDSSHSEITRVEMVVIRKTEPQQKALK